MDSDLDADAADIALIMLDGLSDFPYIKYISDAVVMTTKLNITLSMCINAVAIILSVAGMLTPTADALVHNANSKAGSR